MTNSIYGAAAYQQTAAAWQKNGTEKADTAKTAGKGKTKETAAAAETAKNQAADGQSITTSSWSTTAAAKAAIPTVHKNYGYTIGDVKLSDTAADYYSKLKAKFGNMDFILVSSDMKEQVAQNASSYGNASKMVVLIDEEKLERMATDESYRKKYEGIIAMSQSQLASMKNQLASSGASVRNFGMSVNSDGTTDYFAVLDKSRAAQRERIEKSAQKKAEAKKAEKKAEAKRAEKKRAEKKAEEKALEKSRTEKEDDVDYIEYHSTDINQLLTKIQEEAYAASANSVLTEQERSVGRHFDFKG